MSIDYHDICEEGYVSNCCGANIIWTDICNSCKEHCEPICLDEYDEEDE